MTLRHHFPLDRWTLLVLSGSLSLLAAVVYLDYITTPTLLLLYLVPMMTLSWLARGYWWVVLAVVASAAWYSARYFAPPPEAMLNGVREPLEIAFVNTLTRLGVLTVVGFLCSRLRHFSRRPDALRSSHDSTGLLSTAGLQELIHRRSTMERASSGPVAVLLLDVERKVSAFGGQSTEHGALVGAVIGKLLMNHARAADMCVRLSPNHFMVIMLNTDRTAAAMLDAAVQDSLPEIVRTLDNSVGVWSLLLFCDRDCSDLERIRAHAVNRLVTLKVLGQGHHHSESWRP